MADNEPQDLISRVHRFFGLKPSQEELEKQTRLKAAGEKIESLGKALVEATEREGEAGLAQFNRALQAEENRLREESAHRPKELGSVTDMPFGPDGRPIVQNLRFIHQWDDGFGNTVYTTTSRGNHTGLDHDYVRSLSSLIHTQENSFKELEPQKQTTIRVENSTTAESVQPYREYLQNEMLAKRFEELKTQPKPSRPR